jgi:predicted Fe-Mo cluster-binding NifX family protein
MNICIPTEDDQGLESQASGHFGRAPFFAVVDVDSGRLEFTSNPGCHQHSHSCHHVDLMKACNVDVLICTGIGRRAFSALNEAGIGVLTSSIGTVSEIVQAVRRGFINRLSIDNTCGGGHHRHGGCGGQGHARSHANNAGLEGGYRNPGPQRSRDR